MRLDAGVEEGGEIPIHYDPMIAKLITFADTREAAIRRMARALAEYEVAGVKTTIPFCAFVMDHEAFIKGDISTHFVGEHFNPETLAGAPDEETEVAMLLAAWHLHNTAPKSASVPVSNDISPWRKRLR